MSKVKVFHTNTNVIWVMTITQLFVPKQPSKKDSNLYIRTIINNIFTFFFQLVTFDKFGNGYIVYHIYSKENIKNTSLLYLKEKKCRDPVAQSVEDLGTRVTGFNPFPNNKF